MATSEASTTDPVAQLAQCLSHGRISKPEGILRLVLSLDGIPEAEAVSVLTHLTEIVRASPHNKHALAGRAGLVNALLLNLSRFSDALRPHLLRLLFLAGSQRFSVHDSRSALAQLQRNELAAAARGGSPAATLAAATLNLELFQLLGDVVAASPSAQTPSAFWEMGAGVLGMTGFDLPADRLVQLAARGALTAAFWVQLDPSSSLTTLLSLFDANGCGFQLQLQRVGAGVLRAELLLTETRREMSSPRLFGNFRVQVGLGGIVARQNSDREPSPTCTPAPFEREAVLRSDAWHFVLLTLKRGSLLFKDEALISIDGMPAICAPAFRFPSFSSVRTNLGHYQP